VPRHATALASNVVIPPVYLVLAGMKWGASVNDSESFKMTAGCVSSHRVNDVVESLAWAH